MKNKTHLFWLILIIATALRFYKLGIIPFGYNWDETSIIYNAWGIALWHRDEWANFMPLAFRSFGDYKAPLLFYMLAAPFKLFGVIEPLIRVYSAIAGIIVVTVTYFIGKLLFPKSQSIPLIAMFFVAISPWAVNFSRVGFEANIGLALVNVGVVLMLAGLKKPKLWLLSGLSFALSLYAYHSTKIFVPLFLVFLGWIYFKSLITHKKQLLLSGIVFFLVVSPIIYITFFGNGFERGLTMIFFDDQHQLRAFTAIASEFWHNLKNQFSLSFLVGGQDDVGLRHLTPGSGIVYSIELVLLMYGIIQSIKIKSKSGTFLIIWILLGQLPAVLTHQTPHAVRSLLMIPALQIMAAFGFHQAYFQLKSSKNGLSKIFVALTSITLLINFGKYLKNYYSEYAVNAAYDFQYGYKEALKTASQLGKSKEKIIVTDTYGQPYVYVLLHNRIKPEEYLAGALANYEFHTFTWPYYKLSSIVVGTPEEIPPEDPQVKSLIKIPGTQEIVFVVAETLNP